MTFKKGEFQFAALKLSSPSSMNIHFGIQCSSETQACQICGALLPLKKKHNACRLQNYQRESMSRVYTHKFTASIRFQRFPKGALTLSRGTKICQERGEKS